MYRVKEALLFRYVWRERWEVYSEKGLPPKKIGFTWGEYCGPTYIALGNSVLTIWWSFRIKKYYDSRPHIWSYFKHDY